VLIVSFVMILVGVYENGEGPSGLLTLPEAAWELSLGIYCAWKGFRSSGPLVEVETAVVERPGSAGRSGLAARQDADTPEPSRVAPSPRDPQPRDRLHAPQE
jgi:hypothetical protein